MTHFPTKPSLYKRTWLKDLPSKYCEEWSRLGLVSPPVKKDGTVVSSVPFYAAQQLKRLEKVPVQLRRATKPIVVTTSKIGEPFYSTQLDFDLRTVRPLPLTYNNLLDPHLKHFFNRPSKRRVLEKRGMITSEGDVICHSKKELNQYRDFLYTSHQEMLRFLRADINVYLPRILAKRRAIAEVTSEQRRYDLLKKERRNTCRTKSRISWSSHRKQKKLQKQSTVNDGAAKNENELTLPSDEIGGRKASAEETRAAIKIQAAFKGYVTRKNLAKAYKRNLAQEAKKRLGTSTKQNKHKIWDKMRKDLISTCHTHSCTEDLVRQFEITDIPSMMNFLKDPVTQQTFRRDFLLRLMHTPCMDISGTMVKPLLKDEVRHHSSKFRWV